MKKSVLATNGPGVDTCLYTQLSRRPKRTQEPSATSSVAPSAPRGCHVPSTLGPALVLGALELLLLLLELLELLELLLALALSASATWGAAAAAALAR